MFPSKNPAVHESEYIWDDKRKIIVNSRNLTDYQYAIYYRSMYKRLRPDLTEYDFLNWKERYRIGEYYLNEMRKRLNWETQRQHLLGHRATTKAANQVFEEQVIALSQPHVRSGGAHIERTWEEASKLVNYMTDIANRIQKYRLEYPVARILITKETAKEMEDEVCARIVREMRKPPAARASE